MRTWRWVLVGMGLTWVVVLAVLIATESPYTGWLGNAFWAFLAVGAVVQMIRSQHSTGHAVQAVRPGFQGLGEVQDLYLGRRPVPPVTYGSDALVVPTEVSTRTDPLDDPVWTVGPTTPSSAHTPPSAPSDST